MARLHGSNARKRHVSTGGASSAKAVLPLRLRIAGLEPPPPSVTDRCTAVRPYAVTVDGTHWIAPLSTTAVRDQARETSLQAALHYQEGELEPCPTCARWPFELPACPCP